MLVFSNNKKLLDYSCMYNMQSTRTRCRRPWFIIGSVSLGPMINYTNSACSQPVFLCEFLLVFLFFFSVTVCGL